MSKFYKFARLTNFTNLNQGNSQKDTKYYLLGTFGSLK